MRAGTCGLSHGYIFCKMISMLAVYTGLCVQAESAISLKVVRAEISTLSWIVLHCNKVNAQHAHSKFLSWKVGPGMVTLVKSSSMVMVMCNCHAC